MNIINHETADVWDAAKSSKTIPVIDFAKAHETTFLANEKGNACTDWGFFQIVDHGISTKTMGTLWGCTHNFFSLPKIQKRYLNCTSENPWGYFDQELTKNKRDKKEIFDIGPKVDTSLLDSQDPFTGVTPWPETQPIFKTTMQEHFKTCETLSLKTMGAICVSLRLENRHLEKCFYPHHTSFLRLNYYPVVDPLADIDKDDKEDAGLGVHHHTDPGAVTILCQDNIGRLQVFKDNYWLPIESINDTLVINIGDMIQIWSNEKKLTGTQYLFSLIHPMRPLFHHSQIIMKRVFTTALIGETSDDSAPMATMQMLKKKSTYQTI